MIIIQWAAVVASGLAAVILLRASIAQMPRRWFLAGALFACFAFGCETYIAFAPTPPTVPDG